MKRKEWFNKMSNSELAEEFYYFDVQAYIDEGDNHDIVIAKIINWLQEEV